MSVGIEKNLSLWDFAFPVNLSESDEQEDDMDNIARNFLNAKIVIPIEKIDGSRKPLIPLAMVFTALAIGFFSLFFFTRGEFLMGLAAAGVPGSIVTVQVGCYIMLVKKTNKLNQYLSEYKGDSPLSQKAIQKLEKYINKIIRENAAQKKKIENEKNIIDEIYEKISDQNNKFNLNLGLLNGFLSEHDQYKDIEIKSVKISELDEGKDNESGQSDLSDSEDRKVTTLPKNDLEEVL